MWWLASWLGCVKALPGVQTQVPPPPMMANVVLAGVDVWGTERLDAPEVARELGLVLGAPVNPGGSEFQEAIATAETRIREANGFVFTDLSVITYFAGEDSGTVYVTLDVVEATETHRMAFDPEPTGQPPDPGGLLAHWMAYETQAWDLLHAGGWDPSAGTPCRGGFHCALGFAHPTLVALEDRFITDVPGHAEALIEVLRSHEDSAQRGAAAFALAYLPTVEAVVAAELTAVRDPSSLVRNNAMRVLLGAQERTGHPVVPLAPLLTALRFPTTTDRNKAAYGVLMVLTAADKTGELAALRDPVLADVGELLERMAGLQQPNNRRPAEAILALLRPPTP